MEIRVGKLGRRILIIAIITVLMLTALAFLIGFVPGSPANTYVLEITNALCDNGVNAVIEMRNIGINPFLNLKSCVVNATKATCGDMTIEKLAGNPRLNPVFSKDTVGPGEAFSFAEENCKEPGQKECRYRLSIKGIRTQAATACYDNN